MTESRDTLLLAKTRTRRDLSRTATYTCSYPDAVTQSVVIKVAPLAEVPRRIIVTTEEY